MIEAGSPAPDFTLPDHEGSPVALSDLRGRRVVVYFYPEAGTPGCTAQACGVREHRRDYERAGVTVLGISPDPPARLATFRQEHGLEFTLLADESHEVAQAYGVWIEKTRDGRTFWGNERSTFVVGADGTVLDVLRDVPPREHDERVLAALAALAV